LDVFVTASFKLDTPHEENQPPPPPEAVSSFASSDLSRSTVFSSTSSPDFIFPRQFSYFVLIYVFLISVYTAYLLERIKVKQINRIPDTICLKKIIFEIFLGKFYCTVLD
jgi:hypothetical protein